MASPQPTLPPYPGLWASDVPNQSPKLVIIFLVFLIISTVVVSVRLAWRWAHQQRGWDDWMALCAYIVLLIMSVFGIIAANHGFGKPTRYILPTLQQCLFYVYLYQICYKLVGGFTKLTFCFLYLRIFPQKSFNRLIVAISIIVAAESIAFTIGTVFQCTPIARAWNEDIQGTCTSSLASWYSHAAFNSFMDIIIFILPIPFIRTLKLPKSSKAGLITVFALGAFVIAASIVRMVFLRDAAATDDLTWGSAEALIWTEIDANTAVVVCCMPALRIPIMNLFNSCLGRKGSRQAFGEQVGDKANGRDTDGAWAGPCEAMAGAGRCSLAEPLDTYKPRGIHDRDMVKTGNSSPSTSKSGEAWYDRMLQSLNRDKDYDQSRIGSEDGFVKLSREESSGGSESMSLGAIYKTTDVHVSSSDAQLEKSKEPRSSLWHLPHE